MSEKSIWIQFRSSTGQPFFSADNYEECEKQGYELFKKIMKPGETRWLREYIEVNESVIKLPEEIEIAGVIYKKMELSEDEEK